MLPVFSGVRVAHLLLLLCMYDFSYSMFFVVYDCFPCLIFVPGLHSLDFRYNLGSIDYSLYWICFSEVNGNENDFFVNFLWTSCKYWSIENRIKANY